MPRRWWPLEGRRTGDRRARWTRCGYDSARSGVNRRIAHKARPSYPSRLRQVEEQLAAGRRWHDDDFVFATPTGSRWTRRTSRIVSTPRSPRLVSPANGSIIYGIFPPRSAWSGRGAGGRVADTRPCQHHQDGQRLRPPDRRDARAGRRPDRLHPRPGWDRQRLKWYDGWYAPDQNDPRTIVRGPIRA